MKKKSILDLDRLSTEQYKNTDKLPFVVVLDNVRSLNNIGSVFRTSDAFLVEKIYLWYNCYSTSRRYSQNCIGCRR